MLQDLLSWSGLHRTLLVNRVFVFTQIKTMLVAKCIGEVPG